MAFTSLFKRLSLPNSLEGRCLGISNPLRQIHFLDGSEEKHPFQSQLTVFFFLDLLKKPRKKKQTYFLKVP